MGSFSYVEMKCNLVEQVVDERGLGAGLRLETLSAISPESLYRCYLETFQAGDAQFFIRQDEDERNRYYQEELGFPEVLDNPASFALLLDGTLIGFSLVMSYLKKNYHISCMCILPAYQGRGYGKRMLSQIKSIALENGIETLTLGTEPDMKAFQLYHKAGFEITAEYVEGE